MTHPKESPEHAVIPGSLHIRHEVYGRRSVGNRVHYLLAPNLAGQAAEILEKVVLYCWTKRRVPGSRFVGSRLRPSVWRAMASALSPEIQSWRKLDGETLTERIGAWRADYAERKSLHQLPEPFEHLCVPSAHTVHALLHILGTSRLQQIVDRHLAFTATRQSGVPDLFLYAVSDNRSMGQQDLSRSRSRKRKSVGSRPRRFLSCARCS